MVGSAAGVLACARAVTPSHPPRRTAKGCRAGCPAPFGEWRSGAAERVQASAAVVESAIGLRRRPGRAAAARPSALLGASLAAVAQDRRDPGAIGHAAGSDRAGEDGLLLDQLAHLGLSHLVAPSRGRYRERTRAGRDSFSELRHGPSKPNSPAAELPEREAPADAATTRGWAAARGWATRPGWLLVVVVAPAPAVVAAGFEPRPDGAPLVRARLRVRCLVRRLLPACAREVAPEPEPDTVLRAGTALPPTTPRRSAAGRSGAGGVTTPSTAKPPPARAAADAAAAAIFPAVTVSKTACARRKEFAARSCRCSETVSYTRTKKLPVCSTPPLATRSALAGKTTVSGCEASCSPRTVARQARHWRRCARSATVCAASASPSTKAESAGARRSHSCPDSMPA